MGLCARVRSSAGGARLIVRYARVCARRAERGTRVGWIDNLSAGWQTTPGECLRYVFVSNELGGTVAMLRGNVIVKIVTDAVQPAGLAATGSVMGMLDARENALTVHDTDRLRIIGSAPAGAGPTQLVADRRGRITGGLAELEQRGLSPAAGAGLRWAQREDGAAAAAQCAAIERCAEERAAGVQA